MSTTESTVTGSPEPVTVEPTDADHGLSDPAGDRRPADDRPGPADDGTDLPADDRADGRPGGTGSLTSLLSRPRASRDGSELFAAATDARTVTSAAAALLAVSAPAPSRTWTIDEVAEPPALPRSAVGRPRGSRLAVAAASLVVIAVLGGLGWLVWSAWQYVTTAPDAAQQAHWEQLRGLIDLVVAVVLLVVGTVLGASLQARWTATARDEAGTHARAAVEQNVVARRNADAARQNAAAAVTAGSDLARALELLDQARPLLVELQSLVDGRDRADTRFVTASTVVSATREPHVAGYRVDRGGDLRLAEVDDEAVDRQLTTLATRAGVLSATVDDWLLRRR